MKHTNKNFRCIFVMLLLNTINLLNAQWVQQPFPTTEDLYKVRFVNDVTGWVLGDKAIYKTSDAGKTWAKQDTSVRFGTLLLALNENVIFFSGGFDRPQKSNTGLRRTANGGRTWQTVDSNYFYYDDIHFVNDRTGYVAASTTDFIPAILKTTDGGKTWKTVARNFNPARYEIMGVSFVDEQRGWAVSYDAMIFQINDGGLTWALQDSIRPMPFFIPLRDIQFTTADSGWAVGGLAGNQLMVRTTNGGRQWIATTQTGCSLREVQFLNGRLGWTVGAVIAPPLILQTLDGGGKWTAQTLQPPQDRNYSIESISLLNKTMAWAVGKQGRVYKLAIPTLVTTNPSAQNSSLEKFFLAPGYPSPFQTSTRLNYEIAAPAQVRFAVHDLLGREVALLFSGEKSPGAYSVMWNGRDHHNALLPNGVYFCRLHAADLVLTRKLVLMR